MKRTTLAGLVAFVLLALPVHAQDGILRGKIKKIDLDRMIVTLTSEGKEYHLRVSEDTRLFEAPGKTLQERLRHFPEGAEVFFKPGRRDGKDVAIGLKRVGSGDRGGRGSLRKVDTSGFKPLSELDTGKYHGYEGGLYPGGKNERPAAHEAEGVRRARQVQPLDADGQPSADGKIVLLSIGMSNTAQASQGFQRLLRRAEGVNPPLVFINGAQGGMSADRIQDPDDGRSGSRYWQAVDERLRQAGVTRAQVHAVWIKQADPGPTQGFPGYARKLQAELTRIVQILPRRFPNCKLAYLSSRTYGGYARSPLNPEPYAYESGFSVKWLIERQIEGDAALNYDPARGTVRAPWLSWGPYLWANGTQKRADGLVWEERDFAPADGTHESPSGMEKVGRLLLDFFRNDSTTRVWFLAR